MNIDGTEELRLTKTPTDEDGPTWSLHPTWSPDDEKIYYASTSSGSTQIWGMFASGLGKEQKTDGVALDAPDANVPGVVARRFQDRFLGRFRDTVWGGLDDDTGLDRSEPN